MIALRCTILFLLALVAFGWWLLIGDIYISLAYSNSFVLLSGESTTIVFFGSIGATLLSVALAIYDLIVSKKRKYIPLGLLIMSLSIIPIFWWLAKDTAETTKPAVLQNDD